MKGFHKLAILIVVLASVAGGVTWLLKRSPVVEVVSPTRSEAAEIVYASGVVEPQIWAKVSPLVRERIVELCNCEGDTVTKGTVLARLNDREAQAALAELKARQRLAADELKRQITLANRNIAAQQTVDRARSELAQLEALVAGQTARLESYVLRAPLQGVVLRQDGEVGEIAELGSALFWVGQPKPLLVVADINEEDIPRIRAGQRALLRADAFPNHGLMATVDSITPKGDPVTKTYRVRFALPPDSPLMIGMSVEVNSIVRIARDALLIPVEAVKDGAVFTVAEDGTVHRQEIEIGIRGTAKVEILSGLNTAARVIVPYPGDLADGARVRTEGG